MKARMLIALAALAVLFGGGLFVSDWMQPAEPSRAAAESVLTTAAPTAPAPDEAPVLEEEEAEQETRPIVTRIEGRVVRVDSAGTRTEVREGETFPVGDALQTEGGTATLGLADGSVQLHSDTSARLLSFEDDGAELQLDLGRVTADAGERVLRLAFAESDARAAVENGRLQAISDGNGRLTVATEQGRVQLRARGSVVEIPAGQQSTVRPNGAPSVPREVPPSFFLRVARPARETRERMTAIRGQVAPGSLVRVNGATASVDDAGRFATRIPLREGRNQIVVEAEDLHGRSDTTSYPVVLDTTASNIESDVSW